MTDPSNDPGAEPIPPAPDAHLTEPENPLPGVTLEDLPPTLQQAVAHAGWTELTPVQARAIPYLLARRDVMVQARTGSGKTGAFVLPILDELDPAQAHCQALVLVPTRELARQVTREAELLGGETGIRTVAVYGGVGFGAQLDGFRQGAHLVVGTPGRVLDHLIRGSLDLDGLQTLIFDEADRMMSMCFYPDMKRIASFLPADRASFMFSATYPASVRRLAEEFLREPGFLSLSHDQVHVAETEHFYFEVPAMDKDRCLVRIIEVENPESALIFCNTKMRVNYVATVLQRFGYDADQLSADLSQNARERVMDRLRDHTLRFLVATDVAARGIDITKLSHVINYEVPEDPEGYIHRVGRTGRAGASGIAFTLVDAAERFELQRIAKRFGIDMEPRPLPSHEDVQNIVSQRLTAVLEAKLRSRDRLKIERMQRMIPLARSLSDNEDELPLLGMVLDDYYQQALYSVPEIPPEDRSPERAPRRDDRKPRRGRGSRSTRGRGRKPR